MGLHMDVFWNSYDVEHPGFEQSVNLCYMLLFQFPYIGSSLGAKCQGITQQRAEHLHVAMLVG